VIDQTRTAAASGHAVIVDTTFLDMTMRRDLAAAVEVPFLGIWLHAPLSVLESRIASRTGDASDATVAVLHRSARNDPGPGKWLVVDARDGAGALAAVRDAIRFNPRGL